MSSSTVISANRHQAAEALHQPVTGLRLARRTSAWRPALCDELFMSVILVVSVYACRSETAGTQPYPTATSPIAGQATVTSNSPADVSTATDVPPPSTTVSPLPLAALLGLTQTPSEARVRDLKAESLIADCMKQDGWEYTPVDHSSTSPGVDFGDEPLYGVTRTYELFEGGAQPEFSVATDPNLEYLMSLSEANQIAYRQALYGEDEPDISAAVPGCREVAVYSVSPGSRPDVRERANELSRLIELSASVRAAEDLWSQCMKDLGYVALRSSSPSLLVQRFKSEMQGLTIVDSESDQLEGENAVSFSTPGDVGFKAVGEAAVLTKVQIERLRSFEGDVFSADQNCAVQSKLAKTRQAAEIEATLVLVEEFPELVVQS